MHCQQDQMERAGKKDWLIWKKMSKGNAGNEIVG